MRSLCRSFRQLQRTLEGDRLTSIAFLLGLAVLIGPDLIAHAQLLATASHPVRFIAVGGTIFDGLLFTAVFMLLKGELKRRRQAEASLAQSNEQLRSVVTQLAATNEEKSSVLRIVAHDLRNPLHAIVHLAGFIKEDAAETASAVADAEQIGRSCSEMLRLIEDLLSVASVESGQLAFKLEPVDLCELATKVVQQNFPQARLKNIDIRVLSDAPCRAKADAQRTEQVLHNLVSNAIKFSPPGKDIRLLIGHSGGRVQIAVEDEGPGLSESDKQKLFQPFQRLSARPTAGESSSGLGLSIVKRFVEAQGGRVSADNREQSSGSRFVIELPAAA